MPEVYEYLTEVRYPCDRAELLRRATAGGADDAVLGRLGTLPEQEYDSSDTVHRLLGQPEDPHT
ncbi:DUF2795 domain-containing protein [Amycolatopsis jiangsuensis]|uniref:DUF2795 domain-containing protein n=1 Tax=Amycolatopsis jiangsuensis TaxID=1181879 RepID=A0A840IS47_9PSEU|nr:DUF2795 domain-containing protein [Amycolatopsis jiangsuensis]MBB4684197.1 hypothetical protein [Amycolatopsis jiangsuensis]